METLESLLSSLDPNRTVYIRGISKDATLIDIINHFNKGGDINENDIIFHPINKGIIYITYHDEDSAKTAIQTLNQTELLNVTINVRNFIHKVDSNNKKSKKLNINKDPIVQRKPRNKSKYYSIENNHNHNNNDINITYTCNSIMINYIEYPIPSGKYLLQLLQLSSLGIENDNKIIDIILNSNNTSKEISESMAMFNALQKLGKLKNIDWYKNERNISIYVIGDGVVPLTSLILSLFVPINYKIYSIDPILDFDLKSICNDKSSRIELHKKKSEDFIILNNDNDEISLVIACHSHAPLEEFWNRISTKNKFAIGLPCCGKNLSTMESVTPLVVYDDYEIWSPKRTIYIYSN